jgi:NitT/TauT family transport system permease protein
VSRAVEPHRNGGRRPGRASPWLAVRKELPGRRGAVLKAMAFLLPLAVWAAVSYVPFLWHPMVRITDPGDSGFLTVDARLPKAELAAENARLGAAGERPAAGVAANPIFLPAPHEVGRALYTSFTTPPRAGEPWLHESLAHSIRIIFWGFLLAAAIGVPLGLLCGTYMLASRLVEPFTDFIRYMPAPAFGALAIAVLGIADAPKVAIIFIGTYFQMVLVVANTTRNFDGALIEAAQTLGARRFQLVRRVIVPGVLPNLYNDLRILLGWAWTYLIVAELIGATSGISYFIQQQGKYRNYDNVFAGILIIGIVGLVTDQVLAKLARHLFPWQGTALSPADRRLHRWLAALGRRAAALVHPRPVPARRSP